MIPNRCHYLVNGHLCGMPASTSDLMNFRCETHTFRCDDCQDTGRWDDGTLCACLLSVIRGEDGIGATLARRGWRLRRADYVGTAGRVVIMAARARGLDSGTTVGPYEYVIATMMPTDTEWNAGTYVDNPTAADEAYRRRHGAR